MTEPADPRLDGRPVVHGIGVDPEGRCAHWHGPADIVAIRFPCCGRYFACHDCHEALAGHPAQRWARSAFDRTAVLCGACGAELPVGRYLDSASRCPECGAAFNPRCALHHHLYFEVPRNAEALQHASAPRSPLMEE
jgi:uncharacterized CHY-type Zn-finger protein